MDAGVPLPIPRDIGAGVEAAAFVLAVVPIVGRIFLAWLPPGLPGRHAPRDLPATWAASCLLGLVWFHALRELAPGPAWPYAAFGIPALALVAQLLMAPAGLVPRHEPVLPRTPTLARVAIVAAVLAAGALSGLDVGSGVDVLLVVAGLAAAILAHEALVLARVQPWIRAAALAAIAAAIALLPHDGQRHEAYATLGACAIAAGLVGWFRRGDRRALAIAGLGVAFLVLSRSGIGAAALVLVVPIAAVIGTAKPSRVRAFAWLAGSLAASIAVLHAGGRMVPSTQVWRTRAAVGVELALTALVVCALCATYLLRIRRETPAWNPSGAAESREARVLGIAALTAIAWTHVVSCRLSDPVEDGGYPIHSPASVSCWILLVIAVAIPLARTLDRTRSA